MHTPMRKSKATSSPSVAASPFLRLMKQDHFLIDCPLRNVPREGYVCFNCGNSGHFRNFCPFPPGMNAVPGAQQQPPPPPQHHAAGGGGGGGGGVGARPDLSYGAPAGDLQGQGTGMPPPPPGAPLQQLLHPPRQPMQQLPSHGTPSFPPTFSGRRRSGKKGSSGGGAAKRKVCTCMCVCQGGGGGAFGPVF